MRDEVKKAGQSEEGFHSSLRPHPSSLDLLLACVHCGLCLEACPTYIHTGDENDGPRGRIYLMRAVEEGRVAPDSPTFSRHISRCLGCRACEQACPAGVQYGQLLEAARADLSRAGAQPDLPSRTLRLVLRHVWLHPRRLRAAFTLARLFRDAGLAGRLLRLRVARLISPQLEFALALLDGSSPAARSGASANLPEVQEVCESNAPTARPTPALLFTGCVTAGLFARVNRATKRVLEANNCATSAPNKQVCCGALHAHAGDLEGARKLARRNIEAFGVGDSDAAIVTNAGGCGAMLASYAHLLEDDAQYGERARQFSARVCDISQQLELIGTRPGAKIDESITTYDASCHLLYGQHADEAPLRMLRAIPGLKFAPLEGSEVCCGGAGVYNLIEAELSSRVLDEKLDRIKETGAQTLATGNPGCHMQIAAGARLSELPLRLCHPVELLDESYARAGFYEEAQ